MNTSQIVRFNHHRQKQQQHRQLPLQRWCSSGIFIVLFVSNFLVHLSECHGNSDKEIVLKPHKTSDTDLYYKTEFYQPRNNVTQTTSGDGSEQPPAPVVPWEDVLKHTAFLTLSESHDNSIFGDEQALHLEEALRAATMQGFDTRPVPQFGDIVMLAMGTLVRNSADNTYTFIRSKSICNEDDQIDIQCLRRMSNNVTALWSVQKVRHRDEKGKYRFELRFGIITMDGKRRQHIKRDNAELPLRQYVARQEDYPALFNGQFSDSDLKKRSDFFEDAQPSINQEVINNANGDVSSANNGGVIPAHPSAAQQHFSPSIDRTIFDLLPFFNNDDDDDHLKSHSPPRHPSSSSYYQHRQPHSFGRPVASSSDYYSYYAPPSQIMAAAAPYRPVRPRPVYSGGYGPPSFASLFNPLASSSYVRPVAYKPHSPPEYVRFPDSSYSYSSPYKSYAQPAQYHYSSHHPAVSAAAPVPQSSYQSSSPFLAQMLASTANFNPVSYFLNRNRPPTVGTPIPAAIKPQVYYQRPPTSYFDYKPAESHQFPKKAVYYTQNAPSYDFNIFGTQPQRPQSPYKEMSGAYSVPSHKYVPLQQITPVLSQVPVVSPQPYYQSSIPSFAQSAIASSPSAPSPISAHFPTSHPVVSPFHQISNPFVVQHLQVVPFGQPQQQQNQLTNHYHHQPNIFSQLSIPLTPSNTFRFPPSIPLHDPERETIQTPPPSSANHQSPANPATSTKTTATHGKDLFEQVREGKQRSKFSDPDPLFHSNNVKEVSTTTSASVNKIQATPKVSYFFPKEEENTFKPVFPILPASTSRRNFTENEFKHILQHPHHHHPASYQKVNNFLVSHGKGTIIYATPSPHPQHAAFVQKKPAQPSNIIYGQVMESKVQPPTLRPDFHKENVKSQLPAPSRGTHQPPSPVSPSPSKKPTAPKAIPIPTKRVNPTSTPVNLITPPSTTASSTTTPIPSRASSSTTTRTTTTTTTEPPTTAAITQRTPRGRQYSRSKVTTTTTEKPVLKWMPKRKRPKQEPAKIAATLNNSAVNLPKPHISNRTRIAAQASSPRAVIIPLDDVSMGHEEAMFQRRHEKYMQPTGSPNFAERSNGITTTTPNRNKKRKNHVHHEYQNFVTVPATTTTTTTTTQRPVGPFQAEETIPEPQKNVFTTTPVPTTVTSPATTVYVPTFTSRVVPSTTPVPEVVVHTLERDIYTTSTAPHFLPTIPVAGGVGAIAAGVPMELFELSKAQVKPVETDTPDVELFRASYRDGDDDDDEEEEDDDDDDDGEDDDEDNEHHHRGESNRHDSGDAEEEEEGGLDFIAKSIMAHAKKVFSDTDSNTISTNEETSAVGATAETSSSAVSGGQKEASKSAADEKDD